MNERSAGQQNTYMALMPFGVASRDVCGLKTLIPLADSFNREA